MSYYWIFFLPQLTQTIFKLIYTSFYVYSKKQNINTMLFLLKHTTWHHFNFKSYHCVWNLCMIILFTICFILLFSPNSLCLPYSLKFIIYIYEFPFDVVHIYAYRDEQFVLSKLSVALHKRTYTFFLRSH